MDLVRSAWPLAARCATHFDNKTRIEAVGFMISSLLMISPIGIGSSFWDGRIRITLIRRTPLIECFGINFILLIPWRAPHLRGTFQP
jgi:hypothetical protein